jgi:hypothetical protein
MAWQTQDIPWGNDGTAFASAETMTSDGVAGSTLELGRGDFDIVITSALTDTGVGFDIGLIIVQANTAAATTTWTEIGNLCLGDATGRGTALTTVTSAVVPVKNCGDYQVRLYCYMQGSTTIMTITAKAYPRRRRVA